MRASPKFQHLPIVLSESDPEGCAACSARVYPQNAYRNGPLYASYTAAMTKSIFELADRAETNMAGMLTWAFEFEGQPYFDGFRTLATNGIDKPVLNLFRMESLMHGQRVKAESSGRVPIDDLLKQGVRGSSDVDAMAVKSDRQIAVLTWNYHDDDLPGPEANVQINVHGIPSTATRVTVHHYRIDEAHSNAWAVWKRMGSPQSPSAEQYAALEKAGQLQELEPPHSATVSEGEAKLTLTLPRQAVSLIRLSW